nr:hypothetical protein Iba_chr13fCG6050 [Ipomoea batatas]
MTAAWWTSGKKEGTPAVAVLAESYYGLPLLPWSCRRVQREIAPMSTEPPAPPSTIAKTTMDQLADANTREVCSAPVAPVLCRASP